MSFSRWVFLVRILGLMRTTFAGGERPECGRSPLAEKGVPQALKREGVFDGLMGGFSSSAKRSLALIGVVLIAALFAGAQSTAAPPAQKSATKHSQQAASSSKQKSSGKSKKSKKTASRRGQMKIDSQRAREIQQALIREHYLNGEPSGVWDGATESAMQKFQADNGWQDKTTPDSRALIKLGLGPDHQHLLNPESAMTEPHAQVSAPSSPPSGDAPNKTPQ